MIMKQFIFTVLAVMVTTIAESATLPLPGMTSAMPQKVEYMENDATHGITSIRISGNAGDMEWLVKTDGTQYPWVTDKYEWGTAYFDADGEVKTTVQRHHDGDDMVETYTFTNQGKKAVRLTDIGICTPFNDNYPDARTCMEGRCNVHVWAGGKAAYVNAMRMSGLGAHLGLMVTEGAVTDYELWERDSKKGGSNFRGVLALCPPDMTLNPGKSYRLSWRIFVHHGTDFEEQLLRRGGMVVSSDRYVYEVGQTANVTFRTAKATKTIRQKIDRSGDIRVSYGGTHALLLGVGSEQTLMEQRIRFILDHQQMLDKNDVRYGAFMVYDNEGDSLLTNDQGRSDLDEGRERLGMGCLLAEYCRQHPNPRIQETLLLYADYVRTKLQERDYKTWSNARNHGKHRGYNYAWVADFYFRMYLLTGNPQYARDGYGTMRALYRHFGYGFYCIDYPVVTGLEALQKAGMTAERDFLLYDFCQTADIFTKNGLNFPKSEVNYEQSIIAPAVQFLLEVYQATGNKRYLNAARNMMPALEALQWHQPSHHLCEIGIRHWDCYWFGKRRIWGDTFPHYWSVVTAAAYHRYAQITGEDTYQQRAMQTVRGNLSLFANDGRASCAFVYPRRVNGLRANFADAYANDQDWALLYYLMVNE
jgi:hypothetical protein